jgi:MYXO-CTERM domain-containing protein
MNQTLNLAIVLSSIACSAQVSATTFSFLTDTWTNPSTTQTGFLSQTAGGASNSSTGFTSKDGITLSFTGTFFGTAVSSGVVNGVQGPSFTNATTINPNGFIFGTNNDSNTLVDSAGTFSGNVANYQRWDFSFSQPVILDTLILEDIDSLVGTPGFRDYVAAESFNTTAPGVAGAGSAATYTFFGSPTDLLNGSATIGGNTLTAVGAQAGLGNPNNTPEVRTAIDFGTNAVSSFSLYSFSDRNSNHRLSLNSSSFEVTAVPETSSALLGVLSLGALLRRRRQK